MEHHLPHPQDPRLSRTRRRMRDTQSWDTSRRRSPQKLMGFTGWNSRKRERSSDSPSQHGPVRKKVVPEPEEKLPLVAEMDMATLQEEHEKLKQRFKAQRKHDTELRERISQLESRQQDDGHVLSVINRYWNQLNEDIRILLERFDASTAKDWQSDDEFSKGISVLTQLGTWDLQELDEKLETRHLVTVGAVAKINQALDRLQARQERVIQALRENDPDNIDATLQEWGRELEQENLEISELNASLEKRYDELTSRMETTKEQLRQEQENQKGLTGKVEDLQWELSKYLETNCKLRGVLEEIREKYKKEKVKLKEESEKEGGSIVWKLRHEKEELQEKTDKRLEELQELHREEKELLKDLEGLRVDQALLPKHLVRESDTYRELSSHYKQVCKDTEKMKAKLASFRDLARQATEEQWKRVSRMEQMEAELQEDKYEEIMATQAEIDNVRRQYELLRLEYEQNKVMTDEARPIDEEIKTLAKIMEGRKEQLKVEGSRYRRKYAETCKENGKVKKQVEETQVKWERTMERREEERKLVLSELKKANNVKRELDLILQMYRKNATKEQQEKVELMVSERRLKLEADKVRAQIKALQEEQKKKKKKKKGDEDEEEAKAGGMTAEEAEKRIKILEDQKGQLEKKVENHRQEEDTLVVEMDKTAVAFDDMQERNLNLVQQLREKDSANFKLITERVKDHKVEKFMKEEIQLYKGQLKSVTRQREERGKVIKCLEEKEKAVIELVDKLKLEKEISVKAEEENKKSEMENTLRAKETEKDLELWSEKMDTVKQELLKQTQALEEEKWKQRRLDEEAQILKGRLERQKVEQGKREDEQSEVSMSRQVMQEEIKEYKNSLTCEACRVNRKDGVLTKCFHVFCYECLQKRYEARQRKCPKCGVIFGANDYHKLYLS